MNLPLSGIRVVEISHMVMGPTCGMVLGDLGAEVIKVEPVTGDKTRNIKGLGAGFFRTFNRNKQSIAIDVDTSAGREVLERLLASADVFLENFRPGRMAEMGLDFATLHAKYPRLIHASHKGFLPGPYAHRKALDEVVQMMGGLAYMTGPPGRPLRMGASVNDIMGGVFGALGIMAALHQRDATGVGAEIQSGLFENCAFLAAQHMQQFAKTGVEPKPMPARSHAWAIYDVFEDRNKTQLFVAVVSDGQWRNFGPLIGRPELSANPTLATNNDRVAAREWLIPLIREEIGRREAGELFEALDAAGIPYAPIAKPQDLFNDVHLQQSGALGALVTDAGESTRIPLLPFTINGQRLTARRALPRVGEQTADVLASIGYTPEQIEGMAASGILAGGAPQAVPAAGAAS